MRLDFYTLEFRKFGQGAKHRAQTWRERTKLTKNARKQAFSGESEALSQFQIEIKRLQNGQTEPEAIETYCEW